MTPARDHAVGRFVASLLALAGLVVGVPLVLSAISRSRFDSPNPLAGVDPGSWSFGSVGEALSSPLGNDALIDLVVRTGLVVAWIGLLAVVVTTLCEAIHLVQHRGLALPDVRGLGWVQPMARFIAVGLLVVVPNLRTTASLAEAPLPISTTVAVAPHMATTSDDFVSATAVGRSTANPESAMAAPTTADQPAVHVVARGESLWSIAARYARGDAARTETIAHAIIDLNIDRTMNNGSRFTSAAYLETGWRLTLPDGVQPLNTSTSDGPSQPSAEATGRPDDRDSVVVVAGDTLWDLADEHLGDPTEWTELWEQNADEVMADGRTFSDPDLIIPGWELDLPADGDADDAHSIDQDDTVDAAGGANAPALDEAPPPSDIDDGSSDDCELPNPETESAQPSTPAAPAAPSTSLEPDAPVTSEGAEPTPTTTTPAGSTPVTSAAPESPPTTTTPGGAAPVDSTGSTVASTPDMAPDVPTAPVDTVAEPATTVAASSTTSAEPDVGSTTTTTTATTTTTTTAAAVGGATGSDGGTTRGDPGTSAPDAPIRAEQAALVAAGILTLVGVRRIRRLRQARPRTRVPEPRDAVVDVERRLRSIDPGERATRIDVALRAAAFRLVGSSAQIAVVVADHDGTINLHLTGPAAAAQPWGSSVESASHWRLPASFPIEMLADDARQVSAPCVALTQLGVTPEGSDVLVDVEAFGMLVVDAPTDVADDVVRAVGMGLATSEFAEVAHLVAVSLPIETFLGQRNAYRAESVDAALDLASELAGSTLGEERSTFELRSVHARGEVWEPAVVLLDSADGRALAHLDAPLPAPGHGLSIVTAGSPALFADAAGRLIGRPHGWVLEGFGASIPLRPVGLAASDVADLAELIADAEAPLIDEEDPDHPTVDGAGIDPGARAVPTSGDSTSTSTSSSAVDHTIDHEDDTGSGSSDAVPSQPFVPRPHSIVVGLLGAVEVLSADGRPGVFERSKTVELIAWLATHRDRATRSLARTAMWHENVRDATFANVVSEARRALARLVPPPENEEWIGRTLTEQLPLHELVVTDADLVRDRLRAARLQPPSEAIETLRPAVELIRDLPFAGTSYLWTDAEGIAGGLHVLTTGVTTELAAHALSLGDTELVFWATEIGLRVLPAHEELIALRMRAHAHAGDLSGVRREWDAYERVINSDPWSDGEPAPKLLTLRRELLNPTAS